MSGQEPALSTAEFSREASDESNAPLTECHASDAPVGVDERQAELSGVHSPADSGGAGRRSVGRGCRRAVGAGGGAVSVRRVRVLLRLRLRRRGRGRAALRRVEAGLEGLLWRPERRLLVLVGRAARVARGERVALRLHGALEVAGARAVVVRGRACAEGVCGGGAGGGVGGLAGGRRWRVVGGRAVLRLLLLAALREESPELESLAGGGLGRGGLRGEGAGQGLGDRSLEECK